MGLLSTFDEEENFWNVYPQFKIMGLYKDLYKKDPVHSSKIMWAIAFLCDPSESNIYRNIPEDEKMQVLATDFLEDSKFSWEDYLEEIHQFKQMALSQAERSLVTWNETMAMRDKEVKNLYKMALKSGDLDAIKTLDSILANTAKFYADYEKVAKAYKEELNKLGRGGKIQSLSSSNEI